MIQLILHNRDSIKTIIAAKGNKISGQALCRPSHLPVYHGIRLVNVFYKYSLTRRADLQFPPLRG